MAPSAPVHIGAILFWRRHPLNEGPGARQAGMAGISVALAGVGNVWFATSRC